MAFRCKLVGKTDDRLQKIELTHGCDSWPDPEKSTEKEDFNEINLFPAN